MQTVVLQANGTHNASQLLKSKSTSGSIRPPAPEGKRGTNRCSRSDQEAEDTDLWRYFCEEPFDLDGVEELIKAGECSANIQDKTFGWAPVLMAANAGLTGLLKLLLQAKAKSDVMCHEGNTPLMVAARRGQVETVEFLMSKKVDLNVRNKQGWTALIWSCINGHEDVATSLIAATADFNLADAEGRTACMWASRHGYLEIVEALLVCGINLNARDEAGMTASDHAQEHNELRQAMVAAEEVNKDLIEAARRADKEEVKIAIRKGAHLSLSDEEGWTPLMWSALHGSLDMVTMLVRHGANPNLLEEKGNFLETLGEQHLAIGDSLTKVMGANDRMMHAAKEQSWSEVEDEIKIGSWVNVRDETRRTALMWAARYGATSAVDMLVSKGSHTDERDLFGWTATLFAVWGRSTETVAMLYYHSANFAIRSFEGDSALHIAVRADDAVMVQLLLAAKSEVEEQDVEGNTPLMLAASCGLPHAALALLACGASPKTPDHHKRSPLMKAAKNGHLSVVHLMLDPLEAPPKIPGDHGIDEKTPLPKKKHRSCDKKVTKAVEADIAIHTEEKKEEKKRPDKKKHTSGHSKESRELPSSRSPEPKRTGGKMSSAAKAKLKDVNAPRAVKCESPTHLFLMAAERRAEVSAKLPKIKADSLLKEVDKDGRTPLHFAARSKQIEVIQVLLEAKADVRVADNHGNTVLHESAKANHEQAVRALLEMDIDIDAKNDRGKKPHDLAEDLIIKSMLQGAAVSRILPADGASTSPPRTPDGKKMRSSKQRPIFRVRLEHLPLHLPCDIIEDNIRALMRRLGGKNPLKVEVAMDPCTSKPLGYARVEFADAAEVDLVVRGDGAVLEGSAVHILREVVSDKNRSTIVT